MSLDELHARRLATVVTLVERALDRIETLFRGIEKGDEASRSAAEINTEQIRQIRNRSEEIRRRLRTASERFAIHPHKPDPRQTLGAELSSLWVILENARPRRLKGYGREFDPADKADWEELIHNLLRDVDEIRTALAKSQ